MPIPSPWPISIDGPNRIISILGTGTLVAKDDIYSIWKNWAQVQESDYNLKYPPAFDTTGGDQTTATEQIAAFYFLRNDLGWRIRAPEANGEVVIEGDVFPRDSTLPQFINSVGSFNNIIRLIVSSKSLVSIAQNDLFAISGVVYIDTANGVAGTTGTIGTATNPVNNLADATTIAMAQNIRQFVIRGGSTLTLTQDYKNWAFIGMGALASNHIELNGNDIDDCRFENLTLSGTMAGKASFRDCLLDGVDDLDGDMDGCGIATTTQTVAAGANLLMHHCYSAVAGTGTPALDCINGGAVRVNVRNYSGGIELLNHSTGMVSSFDLDPGHFILGPTNLGGDVLLRGSGRFTDTTGSPRPVVTDGGFHVVADTTLTRKLLQNMMITDPIAGTITVYDDDGITVLLTAPLWEDSAATVPYRGRGAERRERMV